MDMTSLHAEKVKLLAQTLSPLRVSVEPKTVDHEYTVIIAASDETTAPRSIWEEYFGSFFDCVSAAFKGHNLPGTLTKVDDFTVVANLGSLFTLIKEYDVNN